jgi:YggT family protein
MSLIGALLGYALTVFVLLLIARLLLDWAGVLATGPRWVSRARALTHAGTEPVIAPVRGCCGRCKSAACRSTWRSQRCSLLR